MVTPFFTWDFLLALSVIIALDLVLAGDNAIVIGLAARNLPSRLQKRAIIWGTAGAVIIRVLATIFVVYLLKIPGLLFVGGLILIWIGYKLLTDRGDAHDIKAANNLGAAIRTIVIADALMGLDNVVAVAGAAKAGSEEHELLLIILGLLISIPIMIYGSSFVIRIIDRYPYAIYIGAAVLIFTAGKMISGEKWLIKPFLADKEWLKWVLIALLILTVLALGIRKNRK